MKKLLTLLFAFAVALSLTSMPTLAKKGAKKESVATSEGKAHKKHKGIEKTERISGRWLK